MRLAATLRPAAPLVVVLFLAGGHLAGLPSAAHADSVTFVLSNLVFHGPSGQNGLPVPITVSEPGVDGHFLWTYPAGDFAAGTGTLLDLTLPITSMPLSEAIITVDPTGLTGTNPGNYHNLTYDWQIMFRTPLSGPNSTSAIDSTSSTFDFTGVYLGLNGEWLGNIGGTVGPAQATEVGQLVATAPRLEAPSPSPFRERTSLRYSVERAGEVRLEVLSADGRRVATLASGARPAGTYQADWDGRDASGRPMSSGIYYVRLMTGQGVSSRTLALLR